MTLKFWVGGFWKPSFRKSLDNQWLGRICKLVIETKQRLGTKILYGPFYTESCGVDTFELIVEENFFSYLDSNFLADENNYMTGFSTEPKNCKFQ